MFKVEKGIPVPELGAGNAARKYPFNTMEVGDSFFFNGETKRESVDAAASYYGSRHGGMKFAIRKDGDGHRCWRVK